MSDQGGRSGVSYKCYNCDGVFLSKAQSKRVTCSHCKTDMIRWRARVNYAGTIDTVQRLARNGPVVAEELPASTSEARRLIYKITPPKSTGPSTTWPGGKTAKPVLYLPGQERAAVTAFIDANHEFVGAVLDSDVTADPIAQKWPDDLYQLLIEQWYWTGHGEMHVKRRTHD